MSARDVLHRMVDDLDEDEARLLASVAATGNPDRLPEAEKVELVHAALMHALTALQVQTLLESAQSGVWHEAALTALREWLHASPASDRTRFELYPRYLVALPTIIPDRVEPVSFLAG